MPLYTGIDGARREITELYSCRGGIQRNIRLLQAGIDGVSKNIFYSKSLTPISSILIQLEDVYVYSYPNATSSGIGERGDLLHSGDGYSAYTTINISLLSSNQRIRVDINPKNTKQQTRTYFYAYAQLSNGDSIRLADYMYLYNALNGQEGQVTYANWTSTGTSSDYYGWAATDVYDNRVYSSVWGNFDYSVKPPYTIYADRLTNNILYMQMLRVYGSIASRATIGDIKIGGNIIPLTFNNLLTP